MEVGSNLVYWIGVLFTYIFCCKNSSLLEKTKINGKEAGMVYFYKKLSRIVYSLSFSYLSIHDLSF